MFSQFVSDRREAAPRFIVKPGSSVVPENSTVNFNAAVVAASDPLVNWYFGDVHLTQSLKYMQKYSGKAFLHQVIPTASRS